MSEAIYISDIKNKSDFDAVVLVLNKHFGFRIKEGYWNIIPFKYPCEIIYSKTLCNMSVFTDNQLTEKHKLSYDIIDSYTATSLIFYNSGFICPIGSSKPLESKPKFKVGDRVKINWGAFSTREPVFHRIWTEKHGDRLPNECIVSKLPDDMNRNYGIDLGFAVCRVEKEYLTLAEPQPKKWSVGTWVEVVESFGVYNTGDILKITSVSEDFCLFNDSYDIINLNDLEFAFYKGIIKWHAEKPKKKLEEAGSFLKSAGMYPNMSSMFAWGESLRKSVNGVKPFNAFDEEIEEERKILFSDGTTDKNYPTGEFDMTTLNDVVDFMKNQKSSDFDFIETKYAAPTVYKFDNEGSDIEWMSGKTMRYVAGVDPYELDILYKPEVTVDNYEEQDIDINKPKI